MAAEKKLVLITGAAGTYGRILRTEWGDRYNVRMCPAAAARPRMFTHPPGDPPDAAAAHSCGWRT